MINAWNIANFPEHITQQQSTSMANKNKSKQDNPLIYQEIY